jgi:hypothetical protein
MPIGRRERAKQDKREGRLAAAGVTIEDAVVELRDLANGRR